MKREHTDTDITFYMQVYKDYDRAYYALKCLRRCYPDSRVIVISDGDDDRRYEDFITLFNVEYIKGEKLFPIEHGGKMLHRMFEYYFKSPTPTPYFLRMDTDTRFDRKFTYLPKGNFVYGMFTYPPGKVLQGGCVLFPLAIAQKLYKSGVFLLDELKDYSSSWAKYHPWQKLLKKRTEEKKLISFDWILNWCCRKLEINTKEFEEIYSTWRWPKPNRDLRFAVVHPYILKKKQPY